MDHGPDRFARLQKIESGVDLIMVHVVRDIGIDAEVHAHPFVNHAGQLAPTQNTAKGRPAPAAPRDKLKRSGRDFLTRAGHADHRAFAPALMAGLERRAHQLDIAHGLKRLVEPAVRHLDEHLMDR